MKYLLAFDISNGRRRNAVVRCCLAHGFRVQKSVFEIFMERSNVDEFEDRMLQMIDENSDSVRIYPLDSEADQGIRIVGNGKRIEQQKFRII